MIQEVFTKKYIIESKPVPDDFENNIRGWLEEKSKIHNLKWLLIHADDGVIWGELRDDVLHVASDFSADLHCPELRSETVQMARLFGENGELLVWRDDNYSFSSRLVEENRGVNIEYFDETMLLWGTRRENSNDDFFLWEHGSEGLRHAPPVDSNRDLKLKVRHYIDYDEDGQAYIKFSRLVCIRADIIKGVV